MFVILFIVVFTTAGYLALFYLAARRVSRHLAGNPEATKAFVDHVVQPLLGRKAPNEESKP
jgi:uncharacterized protein YneF (UPF0154 family)